MADTLLLGVAADGKTLPLTVEPNGDGTLRLVVAITGAAITLSASEIEIGHVAIKNDASEDHQTVAPDGQAVNATYPLEAAAFMAHDPNGNRWRIVRVDDDDQLVVATKNRTGFKVRVLDTGTVNNEKVGPAQVIPNSMSVLVVADPANAAAVKVGGVGETGVADQFFELQPGDALPTKLSVDNFNKIAAQSPTADQKLFLIAEV